MRISRDREELARMQFGQRASEISRRYAEEGRRVEWMPRGGAKSSAEDKTHIAKLTELCEAWIDIYLSAFAKEGVVPDARDLQEMEARIDQMLSSRLGSDLHRPLVSSVEEINIAADQDEI